MKATAFVNQLPTSSSLFTNSSFTKRPVCNRNNLVRVHYVRDSTINCRGGTRQLKTNENGNSNEFETTTSTTRRSLLRLLLSGVVACTTLSSEKAESRVVVADPNAGDSITKTTSGLQYYDFVSSSTKEDLVSVKSGDEIMIQYTMGTTGARNGWRIDTSTLSFQVGEKDVIGGLNEGVVGMKQGDRRRLLVPPNLGYHSQNDKPIPKGFAEFQRFKNVYLNINRPFIPDVVFDVTLLKIR